VTKQERLLYWLVALVLVAIAAAGVIVDGPAATFRGLIDLQVHPARLINDFTIAAGDGAALFNAALVASIGLVLVRINGVTLSGPTVAAVFTMLGFGLFGKTPLNILPIIAGVWISARIAGKRFREYILIGLFGTALGPLVTLLALELGLPNAVALPVAACAGIAVGILLPAVAIVMLRLHQGFNLYNIGLTTGFLALFSAALILGRGQEIPNHLLWNDEPSLLLRLLIPSLSGFLLASGVAAGGVKALSSYWRILRLPGRLPSDFMDMETVPGALVNMGVLGLAVWVYVWAAGGDLNGPVLGGILTVIGFAAFGKHIWNAAPVVAGVALAAFAFGKDLNAPGVILAALFGTTLAPLAGEFGIPLGVIAGFVHLAIVERTGAWHIGIGLYNNGFAGGLTATLLVSVIEWYRANRPTRKAAADLRASRDTEGRQ
jgi:hypothetical protein